MPPPTVYFGSEPATDGGFDWVVLPPARVALHGAAAMADIAVVKGLLDEAVPVIGALTSGRYEALLRDEFFQLVLSAARAEATLRVLDESDAHTVVVERRLPRPSRSSRIGLGLAAFLDAEMEWSGAWRPRRFPAGWIGSVRAWRWSRGSKPVTEAPIVVAIGGPSERRALDPVCAHLEPGSFSMLDFGIEPASDLASFGSLLTIGDAVRPLGRRAFVEKATEAWKSFDWWGARWLPWVSDSLAVMSRITLREAVVFHEAGLRALRSAEVMVTAKVRYARARALVAAARELGVATVGTQHGMYVAGNEWSDIRTDVFAVAGDSFARILADNDYQGAIAEAGAPFYRIPDGGWDCGIALQPPEVAVITSPADYERHALGAYWAARRVLGDSATIGFRLHPRGSEETLRKLIGDHLPISRDPGQGAARWITVESSFAVEATLSGSPVVLINFNSHPWEYRFVHMPGISVATSEAELKDALAAARAPDAAAVDAWRKEFAVATGDTAAENIASIIRERAG